MDTGRGELAVGNPVMGRSKVLGGGLVALGAALVVAGVLGLTSEGGSSVAESAPTTASASSTTALPTTTLASTTTTTLGAELVAAFLEQFNAAIRSSDTEFLLSRVHPAAIARYGTDQCRSTVSTAVQTSLQLEQLATAGAVMTYRWERDGRTTDIEDTHEVRVRQTTNGESAEAVIHLPVSGGRIHWIPDCGEPIS